jgi:hypothetical protein
MELQDMLDLLNGPQVWYAIVGCLLVVMMVMVYRRLGKLAAASRKELSELREVLAQVADRLEAAEPFGVAEPEKPSGESRFGQPEEDAAGLEEPVAAAAAATTMGGGNETALPDETMPTEEGAEYIPADHLEGESESLAEASDGVFAFESQSLGEDDAASAWDDAPLTEDDKDQFPEPPQPAYEPPEETGEFFFSTGVPESEGGDSASDDADDMAEPVTDEVEEEKPAMAAAEEGADTFLFGASRAADEAGEHRPEDVDDTAAVEPQPHAEHVPSSMAGAGDEDAEPADGESPTDSYEKQAPSVGPFEASAEVPPEPAAVASSKSAPADRQIASLEPLPGNPDKPDVGVARCGECGRKIAYPKRLSGKRMRCPACRTASILP